MLSGKGLLMFQRNIASQKSWISTVRCYHTNIPYILKSNLHPNLIRTQFSVIS